VAAHIISRIREKPFSFFSPVAPFLREEKKKRKEKEKKKKGGNAKGEEDNRPWGSPYSARVRACPKKKKKEKGRRRTA